MAKQSGNVVTFGLSGKVGDLLVFRQVDGKTVVSKVPEKPKTASKKQKAQRQRFRQGVIYAQSAVVAPESKEVYETIAKKKGKTSFTAAVADFLHVPEIRLVDLSNYFGQKGDAIKIEAIDDTMVKYVHVSIITPDGEIADEGEAISDVSGYVWTYTAEKSVENLSGTKIVVSVSDLPGNVVEKSEQID